MSVLPETDKKAGSILRKVSPQSIGIRWQIKLNDVDSPERNYWGFSRDCEGVVKINDDRISLLVLFGELAETEIEVYRLHQEHTNENKHGCGNLAQDLSSWRKILHSDKRNLEQNPVEQEKLKWYIC